MPAITPVTKETREERAKRITARLSVLESQIRTDLKSFNDDFKGAMQRAESAAMSGWQIGKALIEVKSLMPHGAFSDWFERFGVHERTGRRFMESARQYPELKDFVAHRREAILSTGLLPDKEEMFHDGNVTFPSQGQSHLRFYNRFSHWLNEVKSGKVAMDQEQVKNDLKPLYEWLKGLYSE
jgi:hypothetical protein